MKNLFKTIICTVLMIAMVIPLTAVNASAAKAKLSKTSVNVPIGYSQTIKVTGATKVTWSSSDETVVTVTADGASAKLTGKKDGEATVTAKVGSTSLKCAVTVKKSFITAGSEDVSVAKGKSKTVTFKVTGSKDISLSNSDKSVCSTSWGKWDGNSIKLTVKAKKQGTAVITVYAKGSKKSTAEKITVTVGGSEMLSIEEQVVELVNKERKAEGLPALEMDETLNEAAAVRANEIAKDYRKDHTRPDGRNWSTVLVEAGYDYTTAAENLALEYEGTAESVVDVWMNSKLHKANILNKDVTKIGIGVCKADGKYYWVQEFAG